MRRPHELSPRLGWLLPPRSDRLVMTAPSRRPRRWTARLARALRRDYKWPSPPPDHPDDLANLPACASPETLRGSTYVFLALPSASWPSAPQHPDRNAHPIPAAERGAPGDGALVLLLLRSICQRLGRPDRGRGHRNGVPAFKPPEARNAANTMTIWPCSWVILIGISVARMRRSDSSVGGYRPDLARRCAIYATEPSCIPRFPRGDDAIPSCGEQVVQRFPRLAALLAVDGYMPRQFAFRGDRLAYSWGIVALAGGGRRPGRALGRDATLLIRSTRWGCSGVLALTDGWSGIGCGVRGPVGGRPRLNGLGA